jgi:hypothetical protein
VQLNWTTDCQRCHTPVGWKPANFQHPSAFPLTGGHSKVACDVCHKGGVFTALSTDCATCHLTDYQRTTKPNHMTAGFGTNCAQCHTTVRWQGAKFNHPAAFPLTGAHGGLDCSACHKGGVFTGLSTSCVSCHLSDYQKTTDPNHIKSGFGTHCTDCHNTTRWQGAKFNHPAAFPLTLGHSGLACSACHKGGGYTGLSTGCVTCHLSDYQKTTDPNHAKSGFSTDCKSCHTTKSWQGATFNHTQFPLRGPHALSCLQCHPDTSNPQNFTCTNCHAHTRAATTSQHDEVRNFRYQSQACYECHRNGSAEGEGRQRSVKSKSSAPRADTATKSQK